MSSFKFPKDEGISFKLFLDKSNVFNFINHLKISRGSLEELSGDIEDCYEDALIDRREFNELNGLYKSADYLMGRYLKSLYTIEKEGTWKIPNAHARQKKPSKKHHVTSHNIT